MPKFVVCMNSHYVRDSQMFHTTDLNDDEFENVDPYDEMMEGHWHDMEPIPFIDVVEAEDEEKACALAGEKRRYDPRTLYAIQV